MARQTSKKRISPFVFHLTASFTLAIGSTLALWLAISGRWTWQTWLVLWLLAVNVTTLVYYGFDKVRARRARQRVPEVVLHTLALAGGSIGAYAGMQLFRHKTIKGRFQFVFWAIVVLQVGLIAWIVREVWLTP